jgi:hypothetical protein
VLFELGEGALLEAVISRGKKPLLPRPRLLLCASHRAWVTALKAMKTLAPITVAFTIALSGSTAFAETSQERQACIGDAFRVCWSAIPNRDAVFHCLLDNRSQLNVACRMVMDQYRRPHRVTRSARAARVE